MMIMASLLVMLVVRLVCWKAGILGSTLPKDPNSLPFPPLRYDVCVLL